MVFHRADCLHSQMKGAPVMISSNRSSPELSGATKRVAASFQHILVPVDGSQLSEEAIPTAVALAQKAGEAGKITLLRVKQFEPTFYPPENAYGLPKGVHPEVEAYLNQLATTIKAQGVQAETFAS